MRHRQGWPRAHRRCVESRDTSAKMICMARLVRAAAQELCVEGPPRARSAALAYAAFLSKSCFHCPPVARLFIIARWVKARWAAATFSLLPDQAFCGAACSARP
jgi:hypothetical protein